jgi:hypothetical protein
VPSAGDYGGSVLDLNSLDLEEIATALADQTDYEHRYLISPETGEIAFWTSDTGIDGQNPVDLDELDLICINPLPSYVWYQDMADFADQVSDEQAARRLARAIQGKGAFRRFKAELHEEYPQLLPAWHAFRDARARRRAVEWLADNSLVDTEAAARFLGERDGSSSALDGRSAADAGPAAGREWLAALPDELAAQRRVMAGLVDFCEATPVVTSLSVGCSLGRGAADALSDIDAALGIAAESGSAGGEQVLAIEAMVVAALPGLGALVDVLRHRVGPPDRVIRRIFAQFADGTQLDLAVMAEAEVRRGGAAPDFVPLYEAAGRPDAGRPDLGSTQPGDELAPAYAVTGEQVREWAFLGWCALIDADKYLRRGSLWEAHSRLHEARHHIWALWAAATGALYPWHGLSQVLDHDLGNLPPGIESTVAGLDAAGLREAALASADLLAKVSAAAAQRHPADLPSAMAGYVTRALAGDR